MQLLPPQLHVDILRRNNCNYSPQKLGGQPSWIQLEVTQGEWHLARFLNMLLGGFQSHREDASTLLGISPCCSRCIALFDLAHCCNHILFYADHPFARALFFRRSSYSEEEQTLARRRCSRFLSHLKCSTVHSLSCTALLLSYRFSHDPIHPSRSLGSELGQWRLGMLLRFAFSTQQGTETLRWHVERTFRSYGAHLAYAVLHVWKPESVTLNFLLLEIKQFGLCRLGWSAELVWSYRRVSSDASYAQIVRACPRTKCMLVAQAETQALTVGAGTASYGEAL